MALRRAARCFSAKHIQIPRANLSTCNQCEVPPIQFSSVSVPSTLPAGDGRKVAVGISGGVDSAVSAMLLKRAGYDVHGVYMKNWDELDETGHCSGEADRLDAERVCKQLEIPLVHVDFVKEYWNSVFTDMLSDFESGVTPNPDLLCNREIKFSALSKFVREKLGTELLATGHYARLRIINDSKTNLPTTQLLRGIDLEKDQSYFLASVRPGEFDRVLFPMGSLVKRHARSLAESAKLAIAQKRSSRGICFVGKRDFASFISEYIPQTPGDFVSVVSGKAVGTHKGICTVTTGQTARISGMGERWFVVSKDPASNVVFVAPGEEHPALYSDYFVLRDASFISGRIPDKLKPLSQSETDKIKASFSTPVNLVQVWAAHYHYRPRYRSPPKPGVLLAYQTGSGTDISDFQFAFCPDEPAKSITPGQALVLYDGEHNEVCLGSLIIKRVPQTLWDLQRAESQQDSAVLRAASQLQ